MSAAASRSRRGGCLRLGLRRLRQVVVRQCGTAASFPFWRRRRLPPGDDPGARITWAVAHIFFLIGFRNRVMVSAQWLFAYVTHDRAARLIIGPEPVSRDPRS